MLPEAKKERRSGVSRLTQKLAEKKRLRNPDNPALIEAPEKTDGDANSLSSRSQKSRKSEGNPRMLLKNISPDQMKSLKEKMMNKVELSEKEKEI